MASVTLGVSLPLFSGFVPWPVLQGWDWMFCLGLVFVGLWGLWQGKLLDDLQGRNRGFGHDLELNGSSK